MDIIPGKVLKIGTGDALGNSEFTGLELDVGTATKPAFGFRRYGGGFSMRGIDGNFVNINPGVKSYSARSTNLDITCDHPDNIIILNPAGSFTISLDSFNQFLGRVFRIFIIGNTFPYHTITVTSDNGNTIDIIGGDAEMTLVSLADQPSLGSDWAIADVRESNVNHTTNFSFNGSGGTASSNAIVCHRQGGKAGLVTLDFNDSYKATTGTSSTTFTSTVALPARFRPFRDTLFTVPIQQAGAGLAQPGCLRVGADGIVTLFKDPTLTAAYTNAAANTGFRNTQVVYNFAG